MLIGRIGGGAASLTTTTARWLAPAAPPSAVWPKNSRKNQRQPMEFPRNINTFRLWRAKRPISVILPSLLWWWWTAPTPSPLICPFLPTQQLHVTHAVYHKYWSRDDSSTLISALVVSSYVWCFLWKTNAGLWTVDVCKTRIPTFRKLSFFMEIRAWRHLFFNA